MAWVMQAAAPAAAASPPDLQLGVRLQVREARIEQKGEARLEMHASPDGGSRVESNAPPAARRLQNIDIAIQGEARIAPPAQAREAPETDASQPR